MKRFLLLFLLILTSCATLPRANKNCGSKDAVRDQRLYVASHGWHTGIILEPENLNHLMPSLADRFPDCDYYEIGWGDSGFYQAYKITAKITLNAVFVPSETVVHLVGIKGDPVEHFSTSEVQEVSISAEGMKSLCAFVESSFAKDQTGLPIKLGQGLYGDSQFYEGQGKYHLFNGCNKWTAKALCSGGVVIEPRCKISSASVMNELGTPSRSPKTRILHRQVPHRF
jgi:uncharacterized protein (TIGR02117 family)